ncbi:MAG: chorismate mutase [Candidatus Altiarchaeota archaeon]|nr:chorismate mutase [Candidatus Altiarchaeota archaeon]
MDEELRKLRNEIDSTDERILALIEKRVGIARRIGEIKKEKGLDIEDPEREKEILEKVSGKSALDKRFIRGLFASLIEYCKDEETR